MQRYELHDVLSPKEPPPIIIVKRRDTGEWVKYTDAEAEIEKARADERERIVRELEETYIKSSTNVFERGYITAVRHVIERIKSRPAQEPKPLEKLGSDDFLVGGHAGPKINALVDAVNELRSKGTT
jgi:hypothetical protein